MKKPHTHSHTHTQVLPNKPAQIGKLVVLFVWRHTPTATSPLAGLHPRKMRWGMAWWLLCAVCCLAVVVGTDPGAGGDAAVAADAAGAAAVWFATGSHARGAPGSVETSRSLDIGTCFAAVVPLSVARSPSLSRCVMTCVRGSR